MKHPRRGVGLGLLLALCAVSVAAAEWPNNTRLSGNAFLTPGLLQLQNDSANSPLSLALDLGRSLWGGAGGAGGGPGCQGCHGPVATLKRAAPSFPRLVDGGQRLINLDDQILRCRARLAQADAQVEDNAGLALSALLHDAAKGQPIQVGAAADQATAWQAHVARGEQLFNTRIGRINLACAHCHEQSVGRQMRADVVSPANPTGFPIYRMSWQRLGSIERRLRACYSGVQATVPAPGDPVLRELELYLKLRAQGMALDGPSIRR